MNEVHCSPSETDVEKAVHTPCTHRRSPDDKTIQRDPTGREDAEENWKAKAIRPDDDRLSFRPSLSPQLRAARRRPSAFRAISFKLSIPHHAAILGRVPIEAEQLTSMTITQDADLRLQARPLF